MKVDCWMRSWNEIRWTRTLGRRSYHDFHGFELQMNLTSKWAYPISRAVWGHIHVFQGGVYGDRGRTWKGGKTRVFCLSKPKNWHKNRVPGGGTLSYGGSFLAFLRVFRGFWGIPRKRVIFDDFGVLGLFMTFDIFLKCSPYFLDHVDMFHFLFKIIARALIFFPTEIRYIYLRY